MATTIAIAEDTRDSIKEFGAKGESYDDILQRLLKSAKERQLHDLLFDETNTLSVRQALAKAREKWHE